MLRTKRLQNKTALGNPLPAPSRSRRVATNLNLKRRGAPGSGCQASTFDKNMKRLHTALFALALAGSTIATGSEAKCRQIAQSVSAQQMGVGRIWPPEHR